MTVTEYDLYRLKKRISDTEECIRDLEGGALELERIAQVPDEACAYVAGAAQANREAATKYREDLKIDLEELRAMEKGTPR